MLVLTRKSSESIMIGDEIELTILSVSGDKVRIGISAPREVGIFRREVYDAIAERAADGETGTLGAEAGEGAEGVEGGEGSEDRE